MNRLEGPLTGCQLEVARECERRACEVRPTPRYRELCKTVGWLPASARVYRNGLARKGAHDPEHGTARGFCLAELGIIQAPLVGTIDDTDAAVHGVIVELIRVYNVATEGLR